MSFDIIIDWEKYDTKFGRHDISMELRPLRRVAKLLISPLLVQGEKIRQERKARKESVNDENKNEEIIEGGNTESDNDEKKVEELTESDMAFTYKFQEIGEKVFPNHVRNIKGITVNKKDITIDDICNESVFALLAMDILTQLVRISQLSEKEVKN